MSSKILGKLLHLVGDLSELKGQTTFPEPDRGDLYPISSTENTEEYSLKYWWSMV